MINTNPEKRLSEILQFKSASKLVKDLRKEMCGLPTVDIVTDNLYNYVTRITTETSNQSYTSRARPIQREEKEKIDLDLEVANRKKEVLQLNKRDNNYNLKNNEDKAVYVQSVVETIQRLNDLAQQGQILQNKFLISQN